MVLLQRIELSHVTELKALIDRINARRAEAELILTKRAELKEVSSLFTFLYKHGVSETDEAFATLRARHTEGTNWTEAMRRNLPPKPAAGRLMNQKRLPSLDRITSLLAQLASSEHLQMLLLEEVDTLTETWYEHVFVDESNIYPLGQVHVAVAAVYLL